MSTRERRYVRVAAPGHIAGTINVVDTETMELISISVAVGGGMIRTLTNPNLVVDWDAPKPTEGLRWMSVAIEVDDDEDQIFSALVDPADRWNGWLKPLFPKSQVEALMRATPEWRWTFDGAILTWLPPTGQDDEEKGSILSTVVAVNIGDAEAVGLRVWNLTDLGWCWQPVADSNRHMVMPPVAETHIHLKKTIDR